MRPPKEKICTYCLKTFEKLTWDHIPPKSWYPQSTPSTVEKWKVPCCNVCNNEYSKLDDKLLRLLAICLNPNDLSSSGIPEKVIASIDPNKSKNERDRRIREKNRNKLIESLIISENIPEEGLLPNFGSQIMHNGKYKLVKIPDDHLFTFSKRLVRGVTFTINNNLIYDNYLIEISYKELLNAIDFIYLVTKHGKQYSLGTGINITYANFSDDPLSSLIRIRIWNKWDIYSMVYRKENYNYI